MEDNNQHLNKNENASNNSSLSEKRTVDENGMRINWNNPEISEADNIEGRTPEVTNREEKQEQPGDHPHRKEIPNDPSIRNLYDKDPNTATIRSSNADSTFGDGPKNGEQNKTQSFNGDQNDSTNKDQKNRNSDEIDNSENENIEGDNES